MELEKTDCQSCGAPDALVIHEPRYNGFRGRCPHCDGDWPES